MIGDASPWAEQSACRQNRIASAATYSPPAPRSSTLTDSPPPPELVLYTPSSDQSLVSSFSLAAA